MDPFAPVKLSCAIIVPPAGGVGVGVGVGVTALATENDAVLSAEIFPETSLHFTKRL